MMSFHIDTGTPLRSWTIVGSALMPQPAASFSLTTPTSVPTKSRRAADGSIVASASPNLDEQLFDLRATLKIKLSQLAMHLSQRMRSAIFGELDAVLDRESWQDNSALIQQSTFMTFLRFIIFVSPTRLPSLGVGPTGHLLAAWGSDTARIAVEFLAADQAAAAITKCGTRSAEIMTFRGHVVDLKLFVELLGVINCFKDDSR